MGFATGNSFRSNNTGVGPYMIERTPPKDAVDSFIQTYDTVNRWRFNREQEKMRKQVLLDTKLADLDFKTEGIRPESAEFFRQAKERMTSHLAESFTRGVDPTDPRFLKEYNEAQQIKKQYQVLVDGDIAVNKILNDTLTKVREQPDKYDLNEVEKWYRSVYNAPVVSSDPNVLSATQLVTDPPLPRDPTLFELVTKELKDLKPVKTEFTSKGIFEIKEYDDTQLLKLVQSNEQIRDKVMEGYASFADDALDSKSPTQQQSKQLLNAVGNLRKSLGAITDEDAWGVLELRKIVSREENWKGQTAQDKEYWKNYYKAWGEGEEVAKEMNGLFWQLTQSMTGQGSVYQKNKGVMQNVAMPTMLIGKFIDPQPAAVGGQNMKDNYILDFQWSEDQNGNPVFKYKTSESEAMAAAKGGDPYRTTNDFKEIRNMFGYKLGDKASKFASGFDDFARKYGFWDDKTRSYDYKKMKELFVPTQALDIDKAKMLKDQFDRVDTYAGDIMGLVYQGQLQMNDTQLKAYEAFKKQTNREPNKNELKKLLEKYYE